MAPGLENGHASTATDLSYRPKDLKTLLKAYPDINGFLSRPNPDKKTAGPAPINSFFSEEASTPEITTEYKVAQFQAPTNFPPLNGAIPIPDKLEDLMAWTQAYVQLIWTKVPKTPPTPDGGDDPNALRQEIEELKVANQQFFDTILNLYAQWQADEGKLEQIRIAGGWRVDPSIKQPEAFAESEQPENTENTKKAEGEEEKIAPEAAQ